MLLPRLVIRACTTHSRCHYKTSKNTQAYWSRGHRTCWLWSWVTRRGHGGRYRALAAVPDVAVIAPSRALVSNCTPTRPQGMGARQAHAPRRLIASMRAVVARVACRHGGRERRWSRGGRGTGPCCGRSGAVRGCFARRGRVLTPMTNVVLTARRTSVPRCTLALPAVPSRRGCREAHTLVGIAAMNAIGAWVLRWCTCRRGCRRHSCWCSAGHSRG